MIEQNCPTDRLSLLIQDELSAEESSQILDHLEECTACQCKLETLAADAAWWKRTTQGLSGVAVDERSQLPESNPSFCPVEVLLESDQSDDSPVFSAQAILAMLDPPVHPEMLGRIDEFDIEEKIGHGGMGVVFRGFDRALNRPVAVKVMAPHLGTNGVARKRFAREAQAAAAVVHPHVVPIYRVNSSTERPYIAMALVEGRSLQDYILHNGPMETKDVVRVSMQIADGLAAAHRQGLIHRDIKPANILMEKDVSRIMITDFGLARAIDDVAMTQSGCLAGTPHYMSPEQVTGAELDHHSDLFSLGSVMYFIATGCEPFRAESAFAVINKIACDIPSPPQSINADVPETLSRIIGQLLEKNPSDRIESADQLQQLLTEYLAHLQNPQLHPEPYVAVSNSERKKIIKRIGWGLIAVVGLMLAYVFGTSIFSSGDHPTVFENNREFRLGAHGGENEHEDSEHGSDSHHDHGDYHEGESHGNSDSNESQQ